jgi:hypothetical protein
VNKYKKSCFTGDMMDRKICLDIERKIDLLKNLPRVGKVIPGVRVVKVKV